MDIPKEVLPFLQAAKKNVDAAEEVRQATRAGQFLASVVYSLPDPTVLVEYCLEYLEGKNKVKWHAIIPVVATLFAAADLQIVSEAGKDSSKSYPATLIAARSSAFNGSFHVLFNRIVELRTIYHEPERAMQGDAATFVPLLNFALGCALRAFGPRNCVQVAPLEILEHSFEERRWGALSRAWWLPLIKQHVRRADSLFFVTDMLPVAVGLRRREADEDTTPVVKQKCRILLSQVWSTLPALLGTAVDLDIAFTSSSLPKVLIAGLEDDIAKEFVLAALRLAATHAGAIKQAMTLQQELQQQAAAWGLSLDDAKARMQASKAADDAMMSDDEDRSGLGDDDENAEREVFSQQQRELKDVFKSLAIENGLALLNDLPKEEEVASACVQFTAESTVAAMAKTGGLLPQLFKCAYLVYSGATSHVLVDDAARRAQLTFEAVKSLVNLLPQEVADEHLESLSAKLLKLVVGQEESVFPLEMTCLADLLDALVVRATDAKLAVCLSVFTPIIKIDPDETPAARSSTDAKMAARALQRRAYRILRHALDRMAARQDETPTTAALEEIWTNLRDARPVCQASALAARMQCLSTFLVLTNRSMMAYGVPLFANFRQQLAQEVTKEIVTRAREVSKDVRKNALNVLKELCVLCTDCIEHLTQVIAIGLAGDANVVRPATLVCLARVLALYAENMSEQFIVQLCDTGLVTLRSPEKPVVRESIRFALVVVRVCPKEHVQSLLPSFLQLLNNPASPQVRLRVRRLIDRLMKKCGPEVIQEAMPESHKPLITYILRAQRRKARKALKGAKRQVIQGEIESDEGSSDANTIQRGQHFGLGTVAGDSKASGLSSLDDDENAGDVKSVKFAKYAKPTAAAGRRLRDDEREISEGELFDSEDEDNRDMLASRAFNKSSVRKRRSDGTWLLERDGEAIDLQGQDVAANILSKRSRVRQTEEAGDEVTIGEDGRIRVKDTATVAVTPSSRLEQLARARLDQLRKDRQSNKAAAIRVDEDGERIKSNKDRKHEAAIAKRRIGHFDVHTAEKWRSAKAGGDVVTGESGMAPVAYTQLNPMLMKEKYMAQSIKSLSSLFNKNKKGPNHKGKK